MSTVQEQISLAVRSKVRSAALELVALQINHPFGWRTQNYIRHRTQEHVGVEVSEKLGIPVRTQLERDTHK